MVPLGKVSERGQGHRACGLCCSISGTGRLARFDDLRKCVGGKGDVCVYVCACMCVTVSVWEGGGVCV
jgi:hypothetical protein